MDYRGSARRERRVRAERNWGAHWHIKRIIQELSRRLSNNGGNVRNASAREGGHCDSGIALEECHIGSPASTTKVDF